MHPLLEKPTVEDLLALDSHTFSPDVYRRTGAFVMRRALPADSVLAWQHAWADFADNLGARRTVDPYNPVVVHEDIPPALAAIHRCDALLDLMQSLYPDLGLYQQRLLVKDHVSRAPVFLHQDFSYDHGWPEKTAVFVALSAHDADNGGLILYPGTHGCGYLGDTGEIDPAIVHPDWPSFCPSVQPGDIILMHDCTWHGSHPHTRGPDRVLLQITYQPASDPSTETLLRGSWDPARRYQLPRTRFFKRSRASRLRELQAEVNRLKAQLGESAR